MKTFNRNAFVTWQDDIYDSIRYSSRFHSCWCCVKLLTVSSMPLMWRTRPSDVCHRSQISHKTQAIPTEILLQLLNAWKFLSKHSERVSGMAVGRLPAETTLGRIQSDLHRQCGLVRNKRFARKWPPKFYPRPQCSKHLPSADPLVIWISHSTVKQFHLKISSEEKYDVFVWLINCIGFFWDVEARAESNSTVLNRIQFVDENSRQTKARKNHASNWWIWAKLAIVCSETNQTTLNAFNRLMIFCFFAGIWMRSAMRCRLAFTVEPKNETQLNLIASSRLPRVSS